MRNDTQVVPYGNHKNATERNIAINRPHTDEKLRKGEGRMLCVSEIHSTVRVRVEQIHNICPEPTHRISKKKCMSVCVILHKGSVVYILFWLAQNKIHATEPTHKSQFTERATHVVARSK